MSRFVKKQFIFFSLLIIIFIISACSDKTNQEIDLPDISIDESIATNDNETAYIEPNDTYADDEVFTIVWDMYYRNNFQSGKPDDGAIAAALNERFNVQMSSLSWEEVGNGNFDEAMRNIMNIDKLPDIFFPYLGDDAYIESGNARLIPWSMIERYAPRYAAMLERAPEWYKTYKTTEDGTYLLYGFQKPIDILEKYSCYRLDWLEELNIEPNGSLIELSDGVYFTEDAFNYQQFIDIMKGFASISGGRDKKRGMVLNKDNTALYYTATLQGMWGLNTSNVNENGHAVMYYASDGLRSFLNLFEQLIEWGALELSESYPSPIYENIGWWNESIEYLFNDRGIVNWFIPNNPTGKVLITPPEIGPTGIQGVYQYIQTDDIDAYGNFMINGNISDEKLARLLEIFDGVSYDPELFVLTNYGIEGEDFTWIGEPYESGIKIKFTTSEYTKLFITNTLDEEAGKKIYQVSSKEFYDFATSSKAHAMILYPYTYDNDDENNGAWEDLESRYPYKAIDDLYKAYMLSLCEGIKVDETWDAYIESLKACGLDEYNALYDMMPLLR